MRPSSVIETRRGLDDLLERLLGSGLPEWPAGYTVPTDVFRTEDSLVVRMDMPGVDPEDVEVTVQENVLLINGTREFPRDAEKVQFLRRGSFYGDFTQRLSLGQGLDTDKIRARFDRGVLELTIPYTEEIQPKKISISVGDQAELTQ
jgi:HSP20 family protein